MASARKSTHCTSLSLVLDFDIYFVPLQWIPLNMQTASYTLDVPGSSLDECLFRSVDVTSLDAYGVTLCFFSRLSRSLFMVNMDLHLAWYLIFGTSPSCNTSATSRIFSCFLMIAALCNVFQEGKSLGGINVEVSFVQWIMHVS